MPRILKRTDDSPRRSLWQRVRDVAMTDVSFFTQAGVIQGSLEKLEEVLIEADFGVATSMRLVADGDDTSLHFAAEKPTVILVVGVNGAGKTTFIGKLCALMAARGRSALV